MRPLADKLWRASPRWMRHTHATHSPSSGAKLTAVRYNLRHASASNTSIYLHSDELKRASRVAEALAARKCARSVRRSGTCRARYR